MAIRLYKSYTPGTRNRILSDFSEITTSKPEKSLLLKKKKSGGRNDTGKMTIENTNFVYNVCGKTNLSMHRFCVGNTKVRDNKCNRVH